MLVLRISNRSIGYAATGTLSQSPLSGTASRRAPRRRRGRRLVARRNATWPSCARRTGATGWSIRSGKVLYETTGYISHPRVSPKADAVAFLDHPIFGDDRGSVAIVDLAGKKKTLTGDWDSVQGLAWSTSGQGALVHGEPLGERPRSLCGDARRTRAAGARDAGRPAAPGHRPRRARPPRAGKRARRFLRRASRRDSGEGSLRARMVVPARPARRTRRRRSTPSRGRPEARGIPSTCESSTDPRRCGSATARPGDSPDGKWVLASQIMTTPGNDRAPADRRRAAEDLSEGLDRQGVDHVRRVPSGRKARRVRRPRGGKAPARVRAGPRGRRGASGDAGGCHGERHLSRTASSS